MTTHLYRSRDDRMLAGVAGGLAELWDADPSLVRILWALLVPLTGGIALVIYIVMALVVPEELDIQPDPATPPAAAFAAATGGSTSADEWRRSRLEARDARRAARSEARAARRARRGTEGRTGAVVFGLLLILVGAWYLLRQFLPTVDWDAFWPLSLVGLGLVVLFLAVRPRPDANGANGASGGGAS